MSRLLLLALLLLPLGSLADAIYRTTDAQGNVVFTDSPPANATPADRVEIRPTNTARPPETVLPPVAEDTPDGTVTEVVLSYSVTITEPVNEATVPNGPGNFAVRVKVTPALKVGANLQLFIDGEPRGELQRATTWNLTNVYRGQHDLTVGVIDSFGETLTLSEPVRVFVHRPSSNFNNKPVAKPRPPKPQPK